MKIISNDDVYVDVFSTAMFATIPFLAIGITGYPVIMYVSMGLGILFICIFMTRFFYTLRRPEAVRSSKLVTELVSMLQFPYAVALGSMILIMEGYDMSVGLWMALGIVVLATVFVILDLENIENP